MIANATRLTCLTVLLVCGAAASVSVATPPPFTITEVAKSGDVISGVGVINQLNQFPGGRGLLRVAVNNTGAWLIDADTQHQPASMTHEAIIKPQGSGFWAPYIAQGIPGYLAVPTTSAVAFTIINLAMNNAGNGVFALAWAPDDFATSPSGTAVYYNTTRMVFNSGDAITAAGLAAGTVWNAPDANTHLTLNDSNKMLVVSTVTELGVSKRVVVTMQLDSTGAVQSTTLIAKEGGAVGAGLSTWTTIGSGPHGAAMNGAGTVVFSGTTSGGVDGVYSTAAGGAFVASAGGPTPVSGVNWGSLTGAAVSINTAGTVLFRGSTANGTGTFTEAGDAGDVVDGEIHTYGNGPLNIVSGTLSNDQDVDMYRITVTDPVTFSATTIPGGASSGAAFDSVLTLISEPGNGQRGRTQSDNVSSGVAQSTITGGPSTLTAGYSYYLAISTPKSRAQSRVGYYATNSNPFRDLWQADPAGLAVASGLVHWPIPSAGTIQRATTGGVVQSALSAPSVSTFIATDTAGGKLYWVDRAASERIRRSNLDGTSVEDLYAINSFGTISVYDTSGMAVDPVHGYVYWSRAAEGEINRIDLAGTNPTRIIQDYPPTSAHTPAATNSNTFAPESIAIDTSSGSSGKIYWVNTFLDRIERCDLDGNNRVAFIVNGSSVAGAGSIAIDSAGGKIYWTSPAAGLVQRANLSGVGAVETVSASTMPQAIALDTAGGFVYWTNTVDRVIRRASIAGGLPASPADLLAIGPATGERAPDGVGRSAGFVSWARLGVAGSTPLPYQIKLTGATFEYTQTMLVKGNQKVAAVGDPVGGVAGSALSVISGAGGPVKLTDRGDAMFIGQYRAPSIYTNHVFGALFLNTDRLITSDEPVVTANVGTVPLAQLWDGPHSFSMSGDGTYALVQANMLPAAFVQPDYALLFQFTYPAGACCTGTHCTVGTQASCGGSYQGDSSACGAPGNQTTCCPANFNQINGLSVQDIFDFLNAWFAGSPQADFNHSGGLAVQDIFDFLNAWFAGCS